MICKGSLFWYKAKGKKYAALILDEIGKGEYFLILISEELKKNRTIEEIMELPVYTVAWFSSFEMIPFPRIHLIANVFIEDSFNGYAGGYFSKLAVKINNCGQSKTWKHEYRQLKFCEKKMSELIRNSAY